MPPDFLELEGLPFRRNSITFQTCIFHAIQFPTNWEHRLFPAHDRSSNQVTIGVLQKNPIKRLFLDDVMFIEFQQSPRQAPLQENQRKSIPVLEITNHYLITSVKKSLDATKLQQLFHRPTRPSLYNPEPWPHSVRLQHSASCISIQCNLNFESLSICKHTPIITMIFSIWSWHLHCLTQR